MAGVTGCAGRVPLLNGDGVHASAVELESTPFHAQTDHQCGPAALATVLGAAGLEVAPDALSDAVYLPEKRGSLQIELIAATRRHGFIAYPIRSTLEHLLAQIDAGRPVLVLQNLGVRSWPVWHYAVVIGFDRRADELVLRSGKTRRQVLSARRFLRSWELASHWGIVVLAPGELPSDGDAAAYLKAVADAEPSLSPQARHDSYAAALEAWPDEPVALLGLGNSSYASGDLAEAEARYRRLCELQPGNVIARNNLAQVLAETGRAAEAREEIRRALEGAVPATPLYQQLSATREEIERLSAPAAATSRDSPVP